MALYGSHLPLQTKHVFRHQVSAHSLDPVLKAGREVIDLALGHWHTYLGIASPRAGPTACDCWGDIE